MIPVDSASYSSVTGKLVQFMKTRHDVRLFVSYLCSFNHAPLEGHFRRALHVLRYLASTPVMVLSSKPMLFSLLSLPILPTVSSGMVSVAPLLCSVSVSIMPRFMLLLRLRLRWLPVL